VRKLKAARRPEIVGAAVELAGERGPAAVSMRAVAARLGLTPMALYGYFRSKDDLLDAVACHLMGLLPEPGADLPPLERLRRLAGGLRGVARTHPALAGLLFTAGASAADEALVVTDRWYAALLDAGVPAADVPRLERLLTTFVAGFVLSEVEGRFAAARRAARSRRARFAPADLPGHHRLGDRLDPDVTWDTEFDDDLTALLGLVEAAALPDS
jgi:AcrR family transcriptional regulator